MIILLCANRKFEHATREAAEALTKIGHRVHGAGKYGLWEEHGKEQGEDSVHEFTHAYESIQQRYDTMRSADALLVLNYDTEGMAGSIGGGMLMEMGFAHVLGKPVYLLNPIPDLPYRDEIEVTNPIMLGGDLNKIPHDVPTKHAPAPRLSSQEGISLPKRSGGVGSGREVREGQMKRVMTHDAQGKENGFLVELYKEGRLTKAYMTSVKPGSFKGYHLHRVRETNYTAIRGTMQVVLYVREGNCWSRQEHTLESAKGSMLHIPTNVATGFASATDEEAWMINFPDPPYDPELKDEQVEYTEEELARGIVK